jgi:hypothetical protein
LGIKGLAYDTLGMRISERDLEEAARALGITEERRSRRREPIVVREYAPDEKAQQAALRTLLEQTKGAACPATPNGAKEIADGLHAAEPTIPQS